MAVLLAAPFLLPLAAFGPPSPASPVLFADLSPDGGEMFAPDTVTPIAWNATHENDTWFWATLGGPGGFLTRGDFPLQNGTYPWRVHRWNTTSSRVQVCGIAPDGHAGCRQSAGNFTIVATPPYLDLLSPANNATNVPLDAPLVLVMEGVNTSSVVLFISPAMPFTFVWSNGDRWLTLTHSFPFPACAPFSFQVSARGTDGTPLGPYTYTFTTTCPPTVIDFRVVDPVTGPFLAEFSRPMNRSSVQWAIDPPVLLTPVWRGHNTELDLYPSPGFSACTQYTVRVGPAQDMDGNDAVPGPIPNPLAFATPCPLYIVRTSPADGDTDVPLDAPITVWFSRPVNPTSSLLFTVSPPSDPLTYTWSNSDTVVTILHGSLFAPCTRYTVTVLAADLGPGPVPNPWSFTTACPPVPPVINLEPVAPDTVRIWIFQEWTSPDFFRVYGTEDRFAPWPWPVLGETTDDAFDAVGHLTDWKTHFYVVRGVYGPRESGNSSIAVKVDLAFGFNTSSTNVFYVSLPYVTPFPPPTAASDLVANLTDTGPGPPIDVVGMWDARANASLLYVRLRGAWRGTDFPIQRGDAVWLGATRSFHWILLSSFDASALLDFTAGGERWTSLPYTSAYRTASDIVLDLEGSLGPAANTHVREITMWDGARQSLRRFSWTPAGWAGDDFPILPGVAIRLRTVTAFTWTPRYLGGPP